MKLAPLYATLALLLAGTAHAQGMSMPMTSKPAASSTKPAMPLVNAEVTKVDLAKGLLVLKHEDLPNIAMPAMTMGFEVADKKMLSSVKPGDKVRFQAEMIGGRATVTQLEKKR